MGRVGAFVDSFVVGHRAAIVRHAVVHFVLAFVLWSNTLVTTRGRSGLRARGHAGCWEEILNSDGVTHVSQLSACQWLSVSRSDCVQLDRNESSQGGDEWECERETSKLHSTTATKQATIFSQAFGLLTGAGQKPPQCPGPGMVQIAAENSTR